MNDFWTFVGQRRSFDSTESVASSRIECNCILHWTWPIHLLDRSVHACGYRFPWWTLSHAVDFGRNRWTRSVRNSSFHFVSCVVSGRALQSNSICLWLTQRIASLASSPLFCVRICARSHMHTRCNNSRQLNLFRAFSLRNEQTVEAHTNRQSLSQQLTQNVNWNALNVCATNKRPINTTAVDRALLSFRAKFI